MSQIQCEKTNTASKAKAENIKDAKLPSCVSDSLSKDPDLAKLNESLSKLKKELGTERMNYSGESAANTLIDRDKLSDKKAGNFDRDELVRILSDPATQDRVREALRNLSRQPDDVQQFSELPLNSKKTL